VIILLIANQIDLLWRTKMEQKSNDKEKRPASGQGIALGLAFGLIFGLLIDQIAIGLVLGIAVGTGIDATLNMRARKDKES
jgi:hypothetical protein